MIAAAAAVDVTRFFPDHACVLLEKLATHLALGIIDNTKDACFYNSFRLLVRRKIQKPSHSMALRFRNQIVNLNASLRVQSSLVAYVVLVWPITRLSKQLRKAVSH